MDNELTSAAVGPPLERGVRRWQKRLWGVLFYGGDKREAPMLLGAMWHAETRNFEKSYVGEPTRALLFQTRGAARTWCAETHRKWRDGRSRDDIVARWRVVPVRVRETVDLEAPNAKLTAPAEAQRG